MLRYAGQDLGSTPHVVVLGSCKVGNLIVSIPTLKALRQRFSDAVIGFIGSDITASLELGLDCIDWRHSWDDPSPDALQKLLNCLTEKVSRHGLVRLAINLDGFNPVTQVVSSYLQPAFISGVALDKHRRQRLPFGSEPMQAFLADPDWDSKAFLSRYDCYLKTNYIAELFAFQAGVIEYADVSSIELPSEAPAFDVPDVLIHCTTARAAKIWPFDYWRVVVDQLVSHGLTVGLIGSSPQSQLDSYNSGSGEEWLLSQTSLIDLRGKTTLLQLAGACAKARAVISVDAGPMHIAAAMGVPTLAIVGNDCNGVGASPIRLWLPRSHNVERTTSKHSCSLCSDQRFSNTDCVADEHYCMQAVNPDSVLAWAADVLSLGGSEQL